MVLAEKVKRYGIRGAMRRAVLIGCRRSGYFQWRFRNAPVYSDPTVADLEIIERDLEAAGIEVNDLTPDPAGFEQFKSRNYFSDSYHGGINSGIWDEKLLEHWLASELLGLEHFGEDDVYVDIAASHSPWARELRERHSLKSYAIDLARVAPEYRELPYYRQEDATITSFPASSVRGASLQCAYEMFQGDADKRLIGELARILEPGGKVVILPLYMHTHPCAYSTPEYFGRGYVDEGAKEYIRHDTFGVPASRKYNAQSLKSRVLEVIGEHGLRYRLSAIRNKAALGRGIYCHFVLEIFRD